LAARLRPDPQGEFKRSLRPLSQNMGLFLRRRREGEEGSRGRKGERVKGMGHTLLLRRTGEEREGDGKEK